jgi:hypothetical protein
VKIFGKSSAVPVSNIIHKVYYDPPARFTVAAAGYVYIGITQHGPVQTGVPEDAATQKIRSFASLPIGWHFGEGRAPNLSMIASAIAWNRVMLGLGLPKTEAFPGIVGEIMVTGYSGGHYLEVLLEPSGVSITHEENGVEIWSREQMTSNQAFVELRRIVGEICNTSGYSIQNTSIANWTNLRVSPFGIQAMELQSSSSTALQPPVPLFAPMPVATTLMLAESLPFFWSLTTESSQRARR